MSGEVSRERAAEIEAEAIRWAIRLDARAPGQAQDPELSAWLAGDRRRRGALLQARAALHLASTSVADDPLPEWHGEQGEDQDGDRSGSGFARRKVLAGVGFAALAATFGALFFTWSGEDYATATGEVRRVPLADGSLVEINTASHLSVRFEKARRTVVLDQGEAWFKVARDMARPFTVEAGRIRVRAVGTAFSVERREGGAEVLVSEGLVEAWAAGAEGARVRLAAGQRAFIADNAAVEVAPSAAAEVDRRLSWRSGKIDLAGETLEEAVAEFNRYSERKIVITDPATAQERFYGVFGTDDPEGFVRAVNQSLDVQVEIGAAQIRIGY